MAELHAFNFISFKFNKKWFGAIWTCSKLHRMTVLPRQTTAKAVYYNDLYNLFLQFQVSQIYKTFFLYCYFIPCWSNIVKCTPGRNRKGLKNKIMQKKTWIARSMETEIKTQDVKSYMFSGLSWEWSRCQQYYLIK